MPKKKETKKPKLSYHKKLEEHAQKVNYETRKTIEKIIKDLRSLAENMKEVVAEEHFHLKGGTPAIEAMSVSMWRKDIEEQISRLKPKLIDLDYIGFRYTIDYMKKKKGNIIKSASADLEGNIEIVQDENATLKKV